MSNATMLAVCVQEYGGPEKLVIEQLPRPEPDPHAVLVRILAAGVNPVDWKIRWGMLKDYIPVQFPWTPGSDGAGIIEAVGSDVTKFTPGQAVYGLLNGSYAEYAVVPEGNISLKPANTSFEEAATIPVGALTAWKALIDAANIQSGQRVLIHGAAGGVGLFAVQLARWKGAQVIATASAMNEDFVKSLGVDTFIDYNTTPFETVVSDVDVVIDTVGPQIQEASLKVLRPNGVFVSVVMPVTPEMAKGKRTIMIGPINVEILPQITELIESNQLRPNVGAVFPLEEVSHAHELSQTGHGHGRIILRIAQQ